MVFVIIQRLGELQLAKSNEIKLKEKGAQEFGQEHYRYIVLMHSMFFVAFIAEVAITGFALSSWWWAALLLFMLMQGVRAWTLRSLGPYWNTKILVVPNEQVVKRGPYRFLKHPNYVVVTIELVTLPLIFGAYVTMGVFFFLNGFMLLFVRIPAEEQALKALTDFQQE